MYKKLFKYHYTQLNSLPYLNNSEWLLIEDKVADFKDRVLKAYFEEIESFENLDSEFFHPTNEGHDIVELIPGFNKTAYPDRIRAKNTSFPAFKTALDAFNEYINENPIAYYVYGGVFLDKLDISSLLYLLKSNRFKLKSIDIEKEIENLLSIFDHLSEDKIQSMYLKLYGSEKEDFERRLSLAVRLEQNTKTN